MWVKYRKKIRYCHYIRDEKDYVIIAGYRWGTTLKTVFRHRWEWRWQWIGKHYVKKPCHIKKIKTEKDIVRDDWREHKQFKKDKGRADYRNGCKKFCKRLGWRSHRRFSNQALKAENYDKMHRKDYKHFVDPWAWD